MKYYGILKKMFDILIWNNLQDKLNEKRQVYLICDICEKKTTKEERCLQLAICIENPWST